MLTGVNMETKGEFRECALNRSIQLAKAQVQSCQQTCFNFRVLGFPIPNTHPLTYGKSSAGGW